MQYNPIVRNFGKVRRILIDTLDVPRHAVRPSTKLADLVPREHRQRVWRHVHEAGISLPPLMASRMQGLTCVLAPVAWLSLGCYVHLNGWLIFVGAIASLIIAVYVVSFLAKDLDEDYTIGDVALEMTTAEQCQEAGYCYTRNEIFIKVRQVLCEVANLEYSDITPEKSFRELGLFD